MPDKKTVIVAAICILALLLLAVSGFISLMRASDLATSAEIAALQPATAPAGTQPAGREIRVGYLVSYRTGTESGWIGKPYGYGTQMRAARELISAGLNVTPIVEPEGKDNDDLQFQLTQFTNDPIDATNLEALKQLDVIIAYGVWRSDTRTLASIADAVRGGVAFINVAGVGKETPGQQGDDGAPAVALTGLAMSHYAYHPNASAAVVAAAHPLLGDLKPGDEIMLRPNGNYGPLPAGVVPLVEMKSKDSYYQVGPASFDPETTAANVYPLYLARLGKGRIICSNFAPYTDVPKALKPAKGGYYARLCRWIVEEPEFSATAATQPAATQP